MSKAYAKRARLDSDVSLSQALLNRLKARQVKPNHMGRLYFEEYRSEHDLLQEKDSYFFFFMHDEEYVCYRGVTSRRCTLRSGQWTRCVSDPMLHWTETFMYKQLFDQALLEIRHCVFSCARRCFGKDVAQIICREIWKIKQTWFDKIL